MTEAATGTASCCAVAAVNIGVAVQATSRHGTGSTATGAATWQLLYRLGTVTRHVMAILAKQGHTLFQQ